MRHLLFCILFSPLIYSMGESYSSKFKIKNDLIQCCYCTALFETEADIQVHVMHIHFKKSNPLRCFSCTYRTSRLDTMKTHIMAHHTNEKRFECPKCHQQSILIGNLIYHIKRCCPEEL